jgi:hypothetical protein
MESSFDFLLRGTNACREGEGMEALLVVIRDTLQKEQKQAQKLRREQMRANRPKLITAPQWQL